MSHGLHALVLLLEIVGGLMMLAWAVILFAAGWSHRRDRRRRTRFARDMKRRMGR